MRAVVAGAQRAPVFGTNVIEYVPAGAGRDLKSLES
jgi:hypothetical protein